MITKPVILDRTLRSRYVGQSPVYGAESSALNGVSSGPEYLLVAGRAGVCCVAGGGRLDGRDGSRRRHAAGRPAGMAVGVAPSFAGAQRPYVEQVSGALKAPGVRCFCAADERIKPPGARRKSGRQRGITAGQAPS